MPTHGAILSTADVSGKAIRAGTVALLVTDLTKAVTFGSAMPSANYVVVFERASLTASVLYPSAKTVNGFTLNLSVGITETIGFVAVEY